MVWEQGSQTIVMLTRLMKSGSSLCHRYWPDEGSQVHGHFEVHLVSEHIWCEDYLVRSLLLKNRSSGESRTITQFHFLSWPENSVPSSAKAILDFRRWVVLSCLHYCYPFVESVPWSLICSFRTVIFALNVFGCSCSPFYLLLFPSFLSLSSSSSLCPFWLQEILFHSFLTAIHVCSNTQQQTRAFLDGHRTLSTKRTNQEETDTQEKKSNILQNNPPWHDDHHLPSFMLLSLTILKAFILLFPSSSYILILLFSVIIIDSLSLVSWISCAHIRLPLRVNWAKQDQHNLVLLSPFLSKLEWDFISIKEE